MENLKVMQPELTASSSLVNKMDWIIEALREYSSALVAFSGGVDSSVVAKLAHLALGDKAIALTVDSPTLPVGELDAARNVAKHIGICHVIVRANELDDPDFVANRPDRCYHCKKGLASKLQEIARERNLNIVLDGTNAEELQGHRPGFRALKEQRVFSPLAAAGFAKEDVRSLAQLLVLPNAEKPAMACLSSRIEYGISITEERLRRVDQAEGFIRSLLPTIVQIRVRDHNGMARIEVDRKARAVFFDEALLDKIEAQLLKLGFHHVTLDLSGYKTGSMNASPKGRGNSRIGGAALQDR